MSCVTVYIFLPCLTLTSSFVSGGGSVFSFSAISVMTTWTMLPPGRLSDCCACEDLKPGEDIRRAPRNRKVILQFISFLPLLALVKTFGVARLRHLRITVIGLR